MPQESPHETNDTTNSSALGTKSLFYQEVIFVSEKHSLQFLLIYQLEKFPFSCLFLFSGFVKLESANLEWYKCNSHG